MSQTTRVLVVSHLESDIKIIRTCIAPRYQFESAGDAEQCLQIANLEVQPDLIVIDIEMPDSAGSEICKRLKADAKTAEIPILFIGNGDDENTVNLGLALGAEDFINKPLIPVLVIARIKTHIRLKLQSQKLNGMVYSDPLTGLYNRHLLADLGAKKVARAIRHRYNLWLLCIEVDDFKKINDDYGSGVGDKLRIQIAEMLKVDTRREDIVACSTAEQFVVMFDPCGDTDAYNKALRISEKIGKLKVHDRHITVSIGIAKLLDKDMDFDGLLKRADDALFKAKENSLTAIEFAVSY